MVVGCPGETEEEFQQSLDDCRAAKFMKIHIFPFSIRKGTKAADFPDQVSAAVKKERCDRMARLERQLAQSYYQSSIDETLEVLVERESEITPGWVRGTDQRYIPVELPGTKEDYGKFVTARGEKAFPHYLRATR